ncbi:MAG: hypothetical protein A3B90_02995 [Candidatus Magasanikbacteria bacterium RIFCSPHIGHO2_02_FULL_41_13]|uniref:DUF3784 domain-containing protein n=1 Tax=Candidatus Magasanikbacteria bacterium RIFCSPHIGHO2_02_FULL_41_13 TaxID=1798676 RepID=A0A1F6M2V9_9BACT|nr:MAG: hypothetical protein A3B90_02995 [Candidatus Magasanikbacteria bacterium RIFCSPHIGHO2_02_FULL_41_13]
MTYLLGFIFMVLGVFMTVKSDWFLQNFGKSNWAEEHLGGDGSRSMYKILGVLLFFGSLMAMTGTLGNIILGIFGNLFSGLKQ